MNHQRTTPIRSISKVFILWGDHFAEDVATIFATQLRRAGLQVKIVGLSGLQAAGLHGIVLRADLALGQALSMTDKTIALVIPCNVTILQRAEDDPRLRTFFHQVVAPDIRLIVERTEVIEHSSLQKLTEQLFNIDYYATTPNLLDFAQTIALKLAKTFAPA